MANRHKRGRLADIGGWVDPIPRDKDGKVAYPDSLGKPRKLEDYENADEYLKHDFVLLQELFDFYGIDLESPYAGEKLALTLAQEHVPGFDFENRGKGGRPKKWTDKNKAKLVRAVKVTREYFPDFNEKQACKFLEEKHYFHSTSLYARYMEAKRDTKTE